MQTTLTIFQPDGTQTTRVFDLPHEPELKELRDAMAGVFTGHAEHVSVLHDGKRADMFVDDDGHAKGLQRNEAATAVYRNNWLTQHPKTDPESIPCIVGPAVLFDRRVWF